MSLLFSAVEARTLTNYGIIGFFTWDYVRTSYSFSKFEKRRYLHTAAKGTQYEESLLHEWI